jgi:predicted nucleotide-binding protein (sugar kinase/HSP70/actin superfamily)
MPAAPLASRIPASHPLYGKKVWVPRMSDGSARIFAAALRSLGLDAAPLPPSDAGTLEQGARHTSGDECYPAKITMGDCIKILEQPGNDPLQTAFFMATGQGPCRFGQYIHLMKSEFEKIGYSGVTILAPACETGYSDFGPGADLYARSGWRALLAGDLLLKYLLKTRPHEISPGDSDAAHEASVEDVCRCMETPWPSARIQLGRLRESLLRARRRFRRVPTRFDAERLLIGAVGEIFCRLNSFSNQEFVRALERAGAEVWMSDITEWIWYVNSDELRMHRLHGRQFSARALGARLRAFFQKKDEQALRSLFAEDFSGYEEPETPEVLRSAAPYLPADGALGEMTVNTGRSICLAKKGVDGIADISPFTCMNGIVCEAIYPQVSKDHSGIPIRNFYCDETHAGPDRDIGIFLELARGYRRGKPWPRSRPLFPAADERAACAS